MPSSVIRDFHYRPEERRLDVTFTTGRRYRYLEVPGELAEAMKRAFSKGEFFNRHIRDRFRFEREG
jgi:hypothetical protein